MPDAQGNELYPGEKQIDANMRRGGTTGAQRSALHAKFKAEHEAKLAAEAEQAPVPESKPEQQ